MARRVSLSAVWRGEVLAAAGRASAVWGVRSSSLGHRRDDLPGHAEPAAIVVSGYVVGGRPEERRQRLGSATGPGPEEYEKAWTWLHKLRRAMVRPGRDRLAGTVEVDETYLGGLEEGVRGRGTEKKALIGVAAQEDGRSVGRIRLQRIPDASAGSLIPFIEDSVEPGSVIHTDGWLGYEPLEKKGYRHTVTSIRGQEESPSELMPRVHLVVSLLKRWLVGTHQGAVSHKHLDYYLDEFTFRFNRRRSRSRGKLFFRLVQHAVNIEPVPYARIVQAQKATTTGRTT